MRTRTVQLCVQMHPFLAYTAQQNKDVNSHMTFDFFTVSSQSASHVRHLYMRLHEVLFAVYANEAALFTIKCTVYGKAPADLSWSIFQMHCAPISQKVDILFFCCCKLRYFSLQWCQQINAKRKIGASRWRETTT